MLNYHCDHRKYDSVNRALNSRAQLYKHGLTVILARNLTQVFHTSRVLGQGILLLGFLLCQKAQQ